MTRARTSFGIFAASAVALAGLASCESEPKVPVSALVPAPSLDAGVVTADASAQNASSVDAGQKLSPEERRIAAILKKVAKVRGLAALRPVPGKVLDRTALVAEVRKKAGLEYPKAAIERDGKMMELMGFAPAPFDYLKELSKLLEAQLDGFYEPKNGTMYVASDLEGDGANLALAHELVHALQDQHYDLSKRSGYHPGQSDAIMAGSMLAEGDATSAMLDVSLKAQGGTALDLPETMFTSMLVNAMNVGDAAAAPHILRSTLVLPYVDGTLFVHALRREGGFAKVDEAWRNLPVTTEQVLHPEKWASHEPALTVPPPTATALGAGFTRVDQDTVGEAGLRLALEEWIGADGAKIAAAGWGGDRSGTFSSGDTWASVNLVVYDKDSGKGGDDTFAKRAFDKVKPGIEKVPGKVAAKTNAPGFVCVEREKLGPLAVARKGRAFVILAGPAQRSSDAVWAPKGTCALSRKWADEVLAQGQLP